MTYRSTLIAALIAGAGLLAPTLADAMPAHPGLKAAGHAEEVACRVVRERVVRPGGRVEYRTSRICRPSVGPRAQRCVVERERVVRPGRAVTYRTVRRCR